MNVYMTHLRTLSENLRFMDSALQKFCLFQMEPSGLESESSWGYGIGLEQVQAGEVMIPLWHLERTLSDGHRGLSGEEEAAFSVTTMLVVRPIAVPSYEPGARGKEKVAQRGRIIGPSVCITSGRAGAESNNHFTAK